MSIITLLTDFGNEDEYVGVMKGAILSINPSARVVDITHAVNPQDLIQAAYLSESYFAYFPAGTIHVIVVDPGVGSKRSILAAEISGHVFLAPDNGVLTLLMEKGRIESIRCVEEPGYFLETVSQTFHGRDIFAPVAAHISKGVELNRFGAARNINDLAHLPIPRPFISQAGELTGQIISIDHFGNLVTNIDRERIGKFFKTGAGRNLQIIVGRSVIHGLNPCYGAVELQCPLAIINSRGYLEISVNGGSAKNYFMVEKKDVVTMRTSD
ncbi:MAG: SAM-dependent chlorinase/fluorinase [Desulfobacterales bacterium]|nr:SAM-dependent chlorinase/fluorinase [Desulfobacterales bacterium]